MTRVVTPCTPPPTAPNVFERILRSTVPGSGLKWFVRLKNSVRNSRQPLLRERERLVDRKVSVGNPWEPERVGARRSAEAAEGRLRERGRVEPPLPRALAARQVAVLPGYQVRARADPRAGRVHVVRHRRGKPILERHDRRQLPAIEQQPRSAARLPEERDVIEHRLDKALCYVETRHRPVRTKIVYILRGADEVAAAHLSADVVRSGDRLRPRVGRQECQTARHAPLRLELQRVVDRIADGLVGSNHAMVSLVWPARTERWQTRCPRVDHVNRPVEIVEGDDEPPALRADITQIDEHAARNLLLHVQ